MKKVSLLLLSFLLLQANVDVAYPLKRPALPSDQITWLAAWVHSLFKEPHKKSILPAKNKQDFLKRFHCVQQLPQLNAYHMKSSSWMGGWTCGLFALKNAFTIEQVAGLAEPKDFTSTVYAYAQRHHINLQVGTDGFQVAGMGKSLGLKNLNILNMDELGRLSPTYYLINFQWQSSAKKSSVQVQYNGTKATITVISPMHTPKDKMIDIAKNALSEKIKKKLTEQRNVLYQQESAQVAHFVCSIQEEIHWILISVVKFPGQEPSYLLLDNLNKPITNKSVRMKYLTQLKHIFG